MQTFLPYPNFYHSMKCLDRNRLGNQVYREGLTLVRGGWPNHPASKMWRGYEHSLATYLYYGAYVMSERDWHKTETCNKWLNFYHKLRTELPDTGQPPWLGDEAFHASHRSNLLRKDRIWYSQFKWTEPDNLEYVWPV